MATVYGRGGKFAAELHYPDVESVMGRHLGNL